MNPDIRKIFTLFIALIIFFGNCHAQRHNEILQTLKEKYAPDSRTAIWEVEAISIGDSIRIIGKVDNKRLSEVIDSAFHAEKIKVANKVTILENSIRNNRALVKLSTASLRTRPEHSAEMATQAVMGTPLKLLEQAGEWYRVQLPDGYIAYTPANSLQILTKGGFNNWRKSNRLIVTRLETVIFDARLSENSPVSDVVAGSILYKLPQDDKDDLYYHVATPDGREGYILRENATDFKEWATDMATIDSDIILGTAKKMTGRGYLWGGTSPKITDCSGLVKICFYASGYILQRDASQQALYGTPISNLFDATEGDLVFFANEKGNIDHVGIYISEGEFVHCSGQVKTGSLDPSSPDYYPQLIKAIRRYKGGENSPGIIAVKNHPWYF